jgi:hypothetical protein
MARQARPNYIIVKTGDPIYYKRKRVYLLKEAPEKDKLITKREENTRKRKEGRIEFGGGSKLSKAFRDTFASCVESYNNRALAGRLTGIFRKIIQGGSGKVGMRKAEVLKNKQLLAGFEFHKDYLFDQIFVAPLKWQIKNGRKEIVLMVPEFKSKGYIKNPKGASHFRLIVTAGILSDYIYSKTQKTYVPFKNPLNGKSAEALSEYISLKSSGVEIHLPLKFNAAIPDGYSVIACMQIEFYKEEAGTMYSLQTKKAMKVAEVF